MFMFALLTPVIQPGKEKGLEIWGNINRLEKIKNMPKPIEKGFIVDEANDRIITKNLELSADSGVISFKLVFKNISGVSTPHLRIKEAGRAAQDYEMDGKIPPSTGYYLLFSKKTKKRK